MKQKQISSNKRVTINQFQTNQEFLRTIITQKTASFYTGLVVFICIIATPTILHANQQPTPPLPTALFTISLDQLLPFRVPQPQGKNAVTDTETAPDNEKSSFIQPYRIALLPKKQSQPQQPTQSFPTATTPVQTVRQEIVSIQPITTHQTTPTTTQLAADKVAGQSGQTIPTPTILHTPVPTTPPSTPTPQVSPTPQPTTPTPQPPLIAADRERIEKHEEKEIRKQRKKEEKREKRDDEEDDN